MKMPNAKDITDVPTKFLVAGYSGSGKTTLFLTHPAEKKFMYLFDPAAINSIKGFDVEYEQFLPDEIPLHVMPIAERHQETGKTIYEPMTFVNWERDFEERLADGFFKEGMLVGFDSTTLFADIVMDRIQYKRSKLGHWPDEGAWTGQINTLLNIFRRITAVQGITLYTTVAITQSKDRKTGQYYELMAVSPYIRSRIPLLFSEVWLCRCEHDSEGAYYSVQTKPDKDFNFMKTSFRGIGDNDGYENVTIKDWSRPEESGIGRLLDKATNY